jgi:hypothetical protein
MYYYTSTYVEKPWLEAPTYDPIKLHLFKWVLDVDAREAAK